MAMDTNYLIVNTGSASKKYALYTGERRLFFAHFERVEGRYVVTVVRGNSETQESISDREYANAASFVVANLRTQGDTKEDLSDIGGVGVRVVAPGSFFQSHRIITDEYIERLSNLRSLAPLHIIPLMEEIQRLRKLLPRVRVVGISDSAFHTTIPEVARQYALNKDHTRQFGTARIGYHGISVQSVVRTYTRRFGQFPSRAIVCHLGGGSSVTALHNKISVDTSMGFTPLEGVPMSTRTGDVDVGAVLYLAQQLHMDIPALVDYLNTRCGLRGLSGTTDDVRELLQREEAGDEGARLALAVFVYRVQKYIGSYKAILNGLDLLVFTATIGERSAIMRGRICSGLEALGVVVDSNSNEALGDKDGIISSDASAVQVAVIGTDEMAVLLEQTDRIIKSVRNNKGE